MYIPNILKSVNWTGLFVTAIGHVVCTVVSVNCYRDTNILVHHGTHYERYMDQEEEYEKEHGNEFD